MISHSIDSSHFHLLCLHDQVKAAKLLQQKQVRFHLNHWQAFLSEISPLKSVGPQSKQLLAERSLQYVVSIESIDDVPIQWIILFALLLYWERSIVQ